MKNFIQQGEVLSLTAPAGGVTSGEPVLIGSLLVVPLHDAAVGETFEGKRAGVFTIAKLSTDVFTEGAIVYWDDGNSRMTLTATANTMAGYAAAGAGSGETTAPVLLPGVTGF